MTATTAAASGPPRKSAAKSGAADTDTTVPRGNRTGITLPTSARAVQKANPPTPAISGCSGNNEAAAAIETTAAAVVARIRRRTLVGTGLPYLRRSEEGPGV
jgi:hypothetical protein